MLFYALMVIGGIAAAVGMSNQKKGKSWGQPVSIAGVAVAVIAAGISFWNTIASNPMDAAQGEAKQYDFSQGYYVAKWIGEEYSDKSALCITYGNNDAIAAGFEAGCKKAKVNYACTSAEAQNIVNYLDAKSLGKIMKDGAYSSYDIVVVVGRTGTPIILDALMDAKNMKGKKIVGINAGGRFEKLMKDKEEKGKPSVIGFVGVRMDADVEAKPSKNPEENFNKRYILVRRNHLADDMKVYNGK